MYLVAEGQQSSRCELCGNIAFHGNSAEPLRDLARDPMALLREKVLTRLKQEPVLPRVEQNPLDTFRQSADGNRVQEILTKYQVEWQLWAMLVKNFQDPAYHAAYTTNAAMTGAFDQATARYREHRAVMILLRSDHWQAEISDQMLGRLEALAEVQARAESRKGFRLPDFWLNLYPNQSSIMRYGWVFLGMLILARLLMA